LVVAATTRSLLGIGQPSEIVDHIQADRQRVRYRFVAAGMHNVLKARLHHRGVIEWRSSRVVSLPAETPFRASSYSLLSWLLLIPFALGASPVAPGGRGSHVERDWLSWLILPRQEQARST
jgi:hypothetical protein